MPRTQTKAITIKIDAALHAEIKAYLEQNEMTMSEFIALAEQRERQESALTQTEQLLRRMSGSITAYMDVVG